MLDSPEPASPPITGRLGDESSKTAQPPPGQINRRDFEERGVTWPFTVEYVQLGCELVDRRRAGGRTLARLTVTAGGARYALNGMARSHDNLPYADPILRVDEETMKVLRTGGDTNAYEVKVKHDHVRDMAEQLCRPA